MCGGYSVNKLAAVAAFKSIEFIQFLCLFFFRLASDPMHGVRMFEIVYFVNSYLGIRQIK